jgi:hypothetical protein
MLQPVRVKSASCNLQCELCFRLACIFCIDGVVDRVQARKSVILGETLAMEVKGCYEAAALF